MAASVSSRPASWWRSRSLKVTSLGLTQMTFGEQENSPPRLLRTSLDCFRNPTSSKELKQQRIKRLSTNVKLYPSKPALIKYTRITATRLMERKAANLLAEATLSSSGSESLVLDHHVFNWLESKNRFWWDWTRFQFALAWTICLFSFILNLVAQTRCSNSFLPIGRLGSSPASHWLKRSLEFHPVFRSEANSINTF